MMMERTTSRERALKFVVLLGMVSLFADVTYEGARSITGPYLALLGADAPTVGLIAGLGEFIGYGLRLVSGRLADRTGRYWTVTLLGYGLNLAAVPLLALAGSWQIAALLIVAERLGKATRTPARDAILSHATSQIGRGWGFGLHEAMDQVGAVSGPMIVALVLYLKGGYTTGFGILAIPAVLAMSVLITAMRQYPRPRDFEATTDANVETRSEHLPRVFWLYLTFVALSVAGYAHFQLISYHMSISKLASDAQIPVLFAMAMGVDALVAPLIGRMFDRIGLPILMIAPVMTLPIALIVFSTNFELVLLGMILWGAVMAVQETVMRAAIADMTPHTKRGATYGIFNSVYGFSWFVGTALMGMLYVIGINYLVFYSLILELASIALLLLTKKYWKHPTHED